eukprot:scaffold30604_cov63-Phaeocystis_antarctica.AAC.5
MSCPLSSSSFEGGPGWANAGGFRSSHRFQGAPCRGSYHGCCGARAAVASLCSPRRLEPWAELSPAAS